MNRSRLSYGFLAMVGVAGTLAGSLASAAWADVSEAAGNSRTGASGPIEEMVVTAQLRAERLQDVPLSISAVSGEMLNDRGITSLEQLTLLVPGVRMSGYGNPNFIFIRGVGSGNNLATEQSVGTFIDGVYFGRDRAAKAQLFDIERVEVLKGPQVTLFGRNTIGGAFNIITRDPGDEWDGYLQGGYDFELESESVEGALTIPASDVVRIRVGGRYQDGQGWVANEGSGNKAGAPEQKTGRVVVLAEPTDQLTIRLKMDAGALRGGLDPLELIHTSPDFLSAVRSVDPGEDGRLNRRATGPGFREGFDEARNHVDTENYLATIEWGVGEYTLTSLTGHVKYEVDGIGDVDASALSFIQNDYDLRYSSLSQEFRLTSPVRDRYEYVAGLYFSDEDLRSAKAVSINLEALPVVDAAIPGIFPRQVTRNQFFKQGAKMWSAYAQGGVELTDSLQLTLGLRHVTVEKEVNSQELFFSALGERVANPLYNALFPLLGLGDVHAFSDIERKDKDLSGLVRLEYRPDPDWLVYAGYTRGYKAGGFDEDNAAGLPNANEFEAETVDSYQVGTKRTAGRGIVNVDFYYNTISDLQVASFDGVAGFLVTNAAKSVTRGVDIEFHQRLSDRIRITLQAGYLDAYYDRYDEAPGIYPAVTQDLSGRTLPFAPKWTASSTLIHRFSFGRGWDLETQIMVFGTTPYYATFNQDRMLKQEGRAKLDARITFANHPRGFDVALIGRNLTDSTSISFGNPLPLAPLIGANYFAYSDPPRTVAIQLRKWF